jgi:hypothetical protein
MALKDSRLGPGTLKIGPTPGPPTTDFSAQMANVVLTPSVDSTDGTPTLADPQPLPEEKETWALEGSAIQDWEAIAGFVNYCFDHAGELAAFEFLPATAKTSKWAGTCKLTSIPIGGDAGVQITADFSFAIQGKPVRTGGTALEADELEAEAAAA